MSPARFRCATQLLDEKIFPNISSLLHFNCTGVGSFVLEFGVVMRTGAWCAHVGTGAEAGIIYLRSLPNLSMHQNNAQPI